MKIWHFFKLYSYICIYNVCFIQELRRERASQHSGVARLKSVSEETDFDQTKYVGSFLLKPPCQLYSVWSMHGWVVSLWDNVYGSNFYV